MHCNEFLRRYSEYHDDEGELPDRDRFDAHAASCPPCRRYRDVVARGTALLREVEGPEFRDDFRDRLQHRLYLSEFESRRPAGTHTLGNPLYLGLAAAAILAVGAGWGPMLDAVLPAPEARLPSVTAAAPESARARAVPNPGANRAPAALVQPDFWVQSHTLLYEHSSLYQRHRQGTLLRAGIQ
jgi:hypothetical protein